MRMTQEIVPHEFRSYVGLGPWLDDPFQRAHQMAFTFITELLAAPDTPFGRIARNGLLLNRDTEEYLHSGDYGFLDEAYREGTKPLLEAYVDSIIDNRMTATEKAIALSQSLNSLKERFGKVPAFLYGESDEETLLKGGGHCSCKARLLCALCQVIGLEARPVLMWAWVDPREPEKLLGGHTVAEVFLDGQWGFFDPQHHLYARAGEGTIPSVRDIRNHPEVFYQTRVDEVARMNPLGYPEAPGGDALFRYYWYKNFSSSCPISIARHDVNEPYLGKWNWATPEFRSKQHDDYETLKCVLLEMAAKDELDENVYRMGIQEFRQFAGIKEWNLDPP